MKGRRLDNKKNIYQYYKLSVKIKLSMAQFSIILSLAWKFEQYFVQYKMNYINLWMLLFNIMVIILLFNILLSLRKIIHMLINFMCKYLKTSN